MGPLVRIMTKSGSQLVKHLPKLWPLLLEQGNRERLLQAAQNLASKSPTKQLRAKAELTAAVADRMAADAESDAEREQAQTWSRQARNLMLRLDMPVTGRNQKRSQRLSISQQLATIQRAMDNHLDAAP